MAAQYLEGFVKYPEDLPCPQVDTDLTPRERRYISDVGEVKKLRRFQSTFQAERHRISFVFTRAQAAAFMEWYKEDIIEGGAWFYADWPILHKEKRIAYRFVTRPVWDFLARGVYHVSATVELYERKVGKVANVYTSKIYPQYFSDNIAATHITVSGRLPPKYYHGDDITASHITIPEVKMSGYIYSGYSLSEDITSTHITIPNASMIKYIYTNYALHDDIAATHITTAAEVTARRVEYERFVDDIAASHITILAGEMK